MRHRYDDHPDAGPGRTVLRIVLLLVFAVMSALSFADGSEVMGVVYLLGVAAVVAALRLGKAPLRRASP
jgi:hypothetical protein